MPFTDEFRAEPKLLRAALEAAVGPVGHFEISVSQFNEETWIRTPTGYVSTQDATFESALAAARSNLGVALALLELQLARQAALEALPARPAPTARQAALGFTEVPR